MDREIELADHNFGGLQDLHMAMCKMSNAQLAEDIKNPNGVLLSIGRDAIQYLSCIGKIIKLAEGDSK